MVGAGKGDGVIELQRDTPLARKLKACIRREGPMLLSAYMHACLADPEHGYYRTRRAIGAAGDFITAPEISQVFGELIGLWGAVVWQAMGSPSRVRLIELGPGRGTLMTDALRAARHVPGFVSAAQVDLIELSETLRREQEHALQDSTVAVEWASSLEHLPLRAPAIIIGNEFLDALPVDQWECISGDWCARHVGLSVDGAFELVHGRAGNNAGDLPSRHSTASDGQVFEAKHFGELASQLGALARAGPLCGLFIDYGHVDWQLGDTLQAVRGQHHEHPFCSPGEADLSSEVSFADLARRLAAAGVAVDGPVTQAEFLGSLGIVERASSLMAANPERAAEIEMSVMRLMAPSGMGTRYKAIGIRSPALPPLPGFALTRG